jgi:arylsulfatase A-like enzyme
MIESAGSATLASKAGAAIAAAFGLAATLLAGCAPPHAVADHRPSCIWIVVDTLRADHLEWYGYDRATAPELRPLVEHGVLFDNAYTTLPLTTPAIASMLTGLEPSHHGVERLYVRLNDRNVTAASLLHAAGYRTAAFVSSFVMIRDFSNLGRGFDVYDDFVTDREAYRQNYERKAGATLALARAWIERQHREHREPFFCFIHLIDPHGPYTPPGEYAGRFHSPTPAPLPPAALAKIPDYQKAPGVTDANRYRDAYDGEIAYAAHETGRFLDFLRAASLFDSSLILFNADHGEEMGEHGHYFAHGDDLFEQNVHIPLIVKPPAGMAARRGTRVAQPVSIIDLLPTVLAVLGQPRPSFLQGRSLAPLLAGQQSQDVGVFFELRPEKRIDGEVRAGRKILLGAGAATQAEQYDLAADPAERHPLPVSPQATAEITAWSQAARTWQRGFPVDVNSMSYALRGTFIAGRARATAEDASRLRSLGYL